MARLTLLQLNDLHGYVNPHTELFPRAGEWEVTRLGGLARIAGLFNRVRDDVGGAVIALDNGDTFHGTRLAVESRGHALIDPVNALGLEAMTLHWEFAYTPTGVLELREKLGHPMLAANCFKEGTGELFLEPWVMIERAGLKVAVIGLACPIVDKVMPTHFSEGVRFTTGVAELPRWVSAARGEGADLVVLLSHVGLPQDLKIVEEVPGIDVVLSGHTHNRLWAPISRGGALVIQSGCHGAYIGRLDLEIENGRVKAHQHRLIPVTADIPEDPQVADLVAQATSEQPPELQERVGETPMVLHRYAQLSAPMDDVLLKAVAEAAGTEVAFSNGWRYGAPIAPGAVTLEDLWNMIPVNPPVSTVRLTGAEIVMMLEENLERTFAADPFDQMGGYVKRMRGVTLHVKIENPRGARVAGLFIGERPVDENATYEVAFVTAQGVPPGFGVERRDLPVNAIAALRELFAREVPVVVADRPTVLAI